MKSKLKRLARRLLGLSSRQVAGLATMAAVCTGVAIAAAIGQAAVATCLLALLLAAVLAGVVLLSRRIRGAQRSTQVAVRDLRIVVEQLQRRVIATMEKERLADGERHRRLVEELTRTERLDTGGAELLLREQSRQIEALVQLFQLVAPRAPMPAADRLDPADLLGLVHVARSRSPRSTVALGGGASTIWLAYALESVGGRLVAVDHDAARCAETRALLAAHGLASAEVRHVPPAELTLDGRTVDWYDVEALDGLRDIDLLIVDSSAVPAGWDAPASALHVLGRRLTASGAVVVDEPPARVAPRQGGLGLTAQRRLAGRWTTLTAPPTPVPAS